MQYQRAASYRSGTWSWEYKSERIVNRGFILFGHSNSLNDFMHSYNRPYILKTETETETVSPGMTDRRVSQGVTSGNGARGMGEGGGSGVGTDLTQLSAAGP